jgi:hypothetical protein
MEAVRLLSYILKFQEMSNKIQNDMQKEKAETGNVPKMTGAEFEDIVYKGLKSEGFAEEQIFHSPHKFPDFVITDENGEKIGLEVKKTDTAKWEMIGGSIYESLKNEISDTFVIMAKMGGGNPEVRLRKYEECIADLKVTHSPRFYLNLDLEKGEDYLTTHNSRDLLSLSGDALNKRIRELLRSNKSTWWSEAETTKFADLSEEEKSAYLNDGLALFPEIFGSNYENFTPWLIYSCLVWCGNIRDIFSAGGKITLPENGIYISAVMGRAYDNIGSIKERIENMSNEEIRKFWHIGNDEAIDISSIDRVTEWIALVKSSLKISKKVIDENKKLPTYKNWTSEAIEQDIRDVYFEELKKKLS